MEGELCMHLDLPWVFGGYTSSNHKLDINGNIVDELRKANGAPFWQILFGDDGDGGLPPNILELLVGGVVILYDGKVCDNSKTILENAIEFPLTKERCFTVTSQKLYDTRGSPRVEVIPMATPIARN